MTFEVLGKRESTAEPPLDKSAITFHVTIVDFFIIIIINNNCTGGRIRWNNSGPLGGQTVQPGGPSHPSASGSCGSSRSHAASRNNVAVAPRRLQMLHEFACDISHTMDREESFGTNFGPCFVCVSHTQCNSVPPHRCIVGTLLLL